MSVVIGYSTKGGTEGTTNGSYLLATKFTALASTSIVALKIHFKAISATKIRLAIYLYGTGTNMTFLKATEEWVGSSYDGILTLNLISSQAITQGTTYALEVKTQDSNAKFYYDAGETNQTGWESTNYDGPWHDPQTPTWEISNKNSIWAETTAEEYTVWGLTAVAT